MRLLVTGGAGFIGSNFIHHALHGADAACCPDGARYPDLDRPDIEILTFDALTYAGDRANLRGVDHLKSHEFVHADVCDANAVDRAFETFQPDAVVHFAAESHVDRSIAAGDVFVRTNVLGTQVLLDAARRHDVDGFIHISTDEVYGSIPDGSATEDWPFCAGSPYAATKAGADLLALAHHNTYGLPVTVLRCSNNYGPRQHPEKLLPKTMQAALQGRSIPIYGDGLQVRDWLYVRDHAAAILHVLGLRHWGKAYNVAGRGERTNLEIVQAVLNVTGQDDDLIEHVADRPGHDRRYSIDDAQLRATGWAPRTTFEQGLADTLRWNKTVLA